MKDQSNNPTYKKKEKVLSELENAIGIVTTACKRAGIDRSTFYEWKKKDPDFAAKVFEVQNEFAIDYAESKLLKNMEAGKETSIIFFLKTRGRHRGYGQDEQIGTQSTKPPVEWADETDENE